MAKEFTRKIRDTKLQGKNKEPFYTNRELDLLSDKEDAYIRLKQEYHCLTNAIQRIDSLSKYIDVLKKENSNPVKDKVTVELSTGELEKELNQIQRDLFNLYNVEIVSLKESIKELNDTIQNLPLQDLEEFKKKISELEDKINNELSNLEKEIEKINSRLDSLKSSRSSTIVIANYDSHENSKKGADIIIEEGENASEKINEAIQSLKGTGGEVKLMEGTYNLETTINVNSVHLTGIPNASFLKMSSGSSDVIKTVGSAYVSNIITIGGRYGFYCSDSSKITNCISENSGSHGFNCYGSSKITNCISENSSGDGFNCNGLSKVTSCISENSGQGGFRCYDSSKITNCISENSGSHGFNCYGSSKITNCISENSSGDGFNCYDSSKITNCISENSSGNGFNCYDSSKITNCISENSSGNGFNCAWYFKGICSFNTLVGDKLKNDSNSPAVVQYNTIQEEV